MDVGPVRQGLAGGPPEYQEGATILEPDRETPKERGGGHASVRNFYLTVVQSVLLFGADTWILLTTIPMRLEGYTWVSSDR